MMKVIEKWKLALALDEMYDEEDVLLIDNIIDVFMALGDDCDTIVDANSEAEETNKNCYIS